MSPKIKVLYVDDDPINLFLFKRQFADKYIVITAENGSLGMELLKKNTDIQLVFSDFHMPGMDGLEFIALAKKEYPDKDFILLTSSDLTSEIQHSLDANIITFYMRKPLNVNEIIGVVNEKNKVKY